MGITRRWGGNKEVGITRAGYHKEVGVDKEVGITRAGCQKVRVHLPTNYKSHKP